MTDIDARLRELAEDRGLARLQELSNRATPGPWQPENPHKISPKTTVCYLYFGEEFNPETESFNDCLSVASERGLADAEFIAALVNWFRALRLKEPNSE